MRYRRRLHYFIFCAAALLIAAVPAQANGIIDPQMKMLEDELSDAILQGTQFFPNGNGGGVFGFFNPTQQTLTEITFETLIAPNISPQDIDFAFVCNQGNSNPFFMFCRIDYNAVSGRMTIAFWGTNPEPATTHRGIRPLPEGCTPETADQPGCTGTGHFAISLSNSYSLTDDDGGWSFSENPLLFLAGGPQFTVTEIQNVFGATPQLIAEEVPEPVMFALVGSGLIGLGLLKRRRRSQPPA
jgi:hypothetical protein